MNSGQFGRYALVAIVSASAAAGWVLHGAAPDPASASASTPVVNPAVRPAHPVVASSAPLISVSSYGTVTLRVEQQPLEWVLDEIARQSGWSDVRERAGVARQASASAPVTTGTTVTSSAPAHVPLASQPTNLLQAVAQGSDDERYASLLRASPDDGLSLPDETLQRLYRNDASDRVRSLAFQRYVEGRNGDIDELRDALQAGLAVPNEAVQAEARRRLDSLLGGEGIDTSLQ